MSVDSISQIEEKLSQVAAVGLPIYISELDIRSTSDTTQQQLLEERFTSFWNHPCVAGVTFWGYKQGQLWHQDAYLLSYTGAERPALSWLMDYLGR
jgi:GH35 family endo-1,4-beta-xylanase